MKQTITFLLLLLTIVTNAQEISGRITDSGIEGIENATIQVFQNKIRVGTNTSDYDGYYTIKPLVPGIYEVMITSLGCDTLLIKSVPVGPTGRTTINGKLIKITPGNYKPSLRVKNWKKPIIQEPLKPNFVDGERKVLPNNEINDTIISKTKH